MSAVINTFLFGRMNQYDKYIQYGADDLQVTCSCLRMRYDIFTAYLYRRFSYLLLTTQQFARAKDTTFMSYC